MIDMLWSAKDEAQRVAFLALFVLALKGGDKPEKLLSAILLALLLTDDVYHYLANGSVVFHRVNVGHAMLDVTTGLAVGAIALNANRIYPLWIGAAQIIAVLAHCYRAALEPIGSVTYNIMSMLPSYIQLIAMGLGLACHSARQKRMGAYPAWSASFNRRRRLREQRDKNS